VLGPLQLRVDGQDPGSLGARQLEHPARARQISEAQARHPRLPGAEQVATPALVQVCLGYHEAVRGRREHVQPRAGRGPCARIDRIVGSGLPGRAQQQAVGRLVPPPHSSAQLV